MTSLKAVHLHIALTHYRYVYKLGKTKYQSCFIIKLSEKHMINSHLHVYIELNKNISEVCPKNKNTILQEKSIRISELLTGKS